MVAQITELESLEPARRVIGVFDLLATLASQLDTATQLSSIDFSPDTMDDRRVNA